MSDNSSRPSSTDLTPPATRKTSRDDPRLRATEILRASVPPGPETAPGTILRSRHRPTETFGRLPQSSPERATGLADFSAFLAHAPKGWTLQVRSALMEMRPIQRLDAMRVCRAAASWEVVMHHSQFMAFQATVFSGRSDMPEAIMSLVGRPITAIALIHRERAVRVQVSVCLFARLLGLPSDTAFCAGSAAARLVLVDHLPARELMCTPLAPSPASTTTTAESQVRRDVAEHVLPWCL